MNYVWEFLVSKWGELVTPLLDWMYLLQWYWWGVIVIAACVAVALFSPWGLPKKIAAWIASLAVVALWAATKVFRHMRKQEPPPRPPPEEPPRWPWSW